jgi:transposase
MKPQLPKYTINQFRKEFPNNDSCLNRLLQMKLKTQPCCPQCSQQTEFKRVRGRRSFQCSDTDCRYQLYPTAGTIFEKTRTSLTDWFYAIYLMTSTKNGVAAKEIQRQIGVTYKCAFRMMHQIRILMKTADGKKMMGVVEADETYIAGHPKNKHAWQQDKKNSKNRTKAVMAILERNGKVVTKVIKDATVHQLAPPLTENVDRSATLITDSHRSYNFIGRTFFEHIPIKHTVNGKVEYRTEGFKHTNTVEGFFAHLKRTIAGTHICVSVQHLHAYANECAFRYTHRKLGQMMFFKILDQISWN